MTCHSFNCFSTVWGQGNASFSDFWLLWFSSCYFRGELSNGYLKTQTRRSYKWTLKIVAQPYSKVPAILVQKAPLQGRNDVFELYPLSGKNVIIMVSLYLKEHPRGCYVSSTALSHTFPSVVWTFEHRKNSALCNLFRGEGGGGLMCCRPLLNNNYKYNSDFFMGVNLFLALSSIVFLE